MQIRLTFKVMVLKDILYTRWSGQSPTEVFDPYGNRSLPNFDINRRNVVLSSISILIYRHGTQSCRKERREKSRKG